MLLEYIKLNENDNNVTVVSAEGLKKGRFIDSLGVKLVDDVPYANKLAINVINKDQPIIRYGEVIGYAFEDIEVGSKIDQYCMYIKEVDNLDINIPYQSRYKEKIDNRERYFWGYENPDGSVGTKNLLAISTNVQCSEGFINVLVDYLRKEVLPSYPNVDDVVTVSHLYGCGVAIKADNAEIPQRIINNILVNPNFGGQVMMVCLGCEKFTTDMISNVKGLDVIIQQENSFEKIFEESVKMAKSKLEILNNRKRTKQPLSNLRVGLQCGGSDALSGITANPTFGYVADRLVEYGASVIFSEVTEVRDASHIILSRIKDMNLREKFIKEMKWYDNYLESAHVDRSANPSPGNKAGGLATVIDKAMGSVAKSGSSDIIDVLSPGEIIRKKGLSFAATPASDFVCGTCQLASGINLMMFSSGRGTTYNLRQVPVIKVSTNNILANKWHDLVDFNCGDIALGVKSVEELGEELIDLLVDIASGKILTNSDKHGLYNQLSVFNPAPIT